MRVLLIHGIHSPEGENNMTALAPHLEAVMSEVTLNVFSYGFMGFWQARWRNNGVAKKLAHLHKQKKDSEYEVWITHSNGAAVAYLAVEKFGARPDMIININPALDRNLAASVSQIEVIHSDNGRVVNLSQWLPFHIWGDQGKVGYRGKRQDVVNHNASKFGGSMRYEGHGDLFASIRIRDWAIFLAHLIGKSQVQTKNK